MSFAVQAPTPASAGTPVTATPSLWNRTANAEATPTTRTRAARRTSGPPTKGPRDVVLVGVGQIAQRLFFPALQELQQTNAVIVRAIVDSNGHGFDAANATFPDALYVGSLDDVTALTDAIVIVATPTRFHVAQTNAALKRGWHVLCSTPLAPSAAEAALMIAAAQRHERILAVDLRTRLFPAARYLRTLCLDHLLGPPLSFRVDVGQMHAATNASPKTEKLEHVDGALAALGAPTLDLLTWCLGSAGLVSYADDAMGGVEATAVIELTFGHGVRGTVHLSRDWPTEDTYTFVFERGIVHWTPHQPGALTLQIASAPFAIAGECAAPLSAVHANSPASARATEAAACVEQLENLIAAIAGRSALRTPATEAMHSLPLIDECYARRSPLPQPWLSHNDAAHARALSPPPILRRP